MTRDEEWLLTEKYHGEKTEGFFADQHRLHCGEPLAYIIGWVPFLHTRIVLDSHPLIPRPETEFWVEKAIQEIKKSDQEHARVLDLCAGSGCIGVAVLASLPHTLVDFAEFNTTHHPTIEQNIEGNDIAHDRARILGGNLFEKLTQVTYDYILTNPPYIDASKHTVDASVHAHEPHEALFGGMNGVEYIERIVTDAPHHLSTQGILYIEHEPWQQEHLVSLARRYNFDVSTHTDQYGVVRYSRLSLRAV